MNKDLLEKLFEHVDEQIRARAYDITSKQFGEILDKVLKDLGDMLKRKNESYGNSSLNPQRIFSTSISAMDGIDVRMDDKITRIKNGASFGDDNDERDLIGYLLIKQVKYELDKNNDIDCATSYKLFK